MQRGMSLVELIIATAVMVLIFSALIAFFQSAVELIGNAKAKSGAIALANERLEYIRSLSYADVGTEGGIPQGDLPQMSTTTLNGITYSERILIEYVDAEEDGIGADDENGIVADYKRAKVELQWDDRGETETVSLISNIVPRGIETTEGGGTIRVNVFDADIEPVPGASVHLYNNTTTSTIDITRFANSDGVALFSGAPAAANYELTVSGIGLSSDQTYAASPANPNPSTPHVAVIESAVSTMNFQIDALSDLTVETVNEPVVVSVDDFFNDTGSVENLSNIEIASSTARLSGSPGSYPSSGMIYSTPISPANIERWSTVSFSATTTEYALVSVSLYTKTGSSTYALVPDSVLPGNSTGFSPGTVDISGIDSTTYPALVLGGALTSSDASETPLLRDWTVEYVQSETPLGSIPFTLTGAKTIGTYADESPVYKYQASHTTNGSGIATLADLEWDVYTLELETASYDIVEACENIPYVLNPGVSEDLKLTLAASEPQTLRVRVENASGDPIIGATVTLARSETFSVSDATSACGQVFFNDGLVAASDYSVLVEAAGYNDGSVVGMTIDGDEAVTVVLSAS